MTRNQKLSVAGAAAVVLVALPAVVAVMVTRETFSSRNPTALTAALPPAGIQASPAGAGRKPLVGLPAEVAHFVEHADGRAQVLQECGTMDRRGPECVSAKEAQEFIVQEAIDYNNAEYKRRMEAICVREPSEPKPALLCD